MAMVYNMATVITLAMLIQESHRVKFRHVACRHVAGATCLRSLSQRANCRKQWTPLLRSCEHNAVLVCDLAHLSSGNDLENLPTGFVRVRRS